MNYTVKLSIYLPTVQPKSKKVNLLTIYADHLCRLGKVVFGAQVMLRHHSKIFSLGSFRDCACTCAVLKMLKQNIFWQLQSLDKGHLSIDIKFHCSMHNSFQDIRMWKMPLFDSNIRNVMYRILKCTMDR